MINFYSLIHSAFFLNDNEKLLNNKTKELY